MFANNEAIAKANLTILNFTQNASSTPLQCCEVFFLNAIRVGQG